MKNKCIIVSIFIGIILLFNFSFASGENSVKRVVSIVYDDSSSMLSNNNFCYSNYALQILTAAMKSDDELNIVKMSQYFNNNEMDLSTMSKRQAYIDDIRRYEHRAGTPFESITTAKNWLINKSSQYKDEAQYWLVVITDGSFSGLPADLTQYMTDLNNSFNNLSFETILLTIGTQSDMQVKDIVRTSANSTVIEARDKESIYSSLMNISKMINNGASDKFITLEKKDDKTISLKTNYPLQKMMVLLQNDDNYITSVKNGNIYFDKETYNVGYPTENLKGSLTHVLPNSGEYLDQGEYIIEFNKNIELNNDITFLCEAFVKCEIKVVNEDDKGLTNGQLNFLTKNDMVRVKCEIINAVDGSKLNGVSGLDVQLVNNKNKYKMEYDESKNAFYAELTLLEDKNNIYAVIDATDLFRIKSNVILIDTAVGMANIERYKNNLIEIEVPYSSSKEYEKLSQFRFSFLEDGTSNYAEKFDLELIDLPDGIRFSYQGKKYKNEDKIPMIREYGKEYVLDILVNKDYIDTDETIITLKILSDEAGSVVYWTSTGFDEEYIKIKPKAYPIKLINKNNDSDIDVQEETLILNIVRTADEAENSPIVGYIKTEDIKKINSKNNFMSGFTFKVFKNDKSNTLDVQIKPNIFALFGKDIANINIELILNNEIESGEYIEDIKVSNISVWLILRPYILGFIGIIIILGYTTKKKFNKKSQITITEGSDSTSYALKPELKTLLLPYVSHKAKIGVIEFIAGKGSDIVFSGRNLVIKQINGENFEEYIQNDNINLDKIVMKKDLSVVTVEAFDVIQKYEYLTKEVEISEYADEDFSSDYSDEEF